MSATQALGSTMQQMVGPAKPTSERLLCLDVFRGLAVAGMILVDNPGSDDLAYWPIKHADWNGWTPADFIFPSFLFLVGISMVFSFAARLQRGESRKQILFHAFKRSLILIAIGLFVNASPVIGLDLHTWRFEGVTQRIALCYFAAAVLVLWSGRRGTLITICTCLLGYWALLRFVPVPGFGRPAESIPFMDPDRNLVAWLDRKLFMGHLYNGTRDPEGILSTIPAIATTLIGVLTGYWLRSKRSSAAKATGMACAGILGLVAGEIWNLWFPINKNLWTSSFVLFSGGFALVFLGLLYWILEIRKWSGIWTTPILVFGMNAIAGFVADSFVYGPGYSFTVKGPNGPVMWHDAAQARLVSLGASAPNASLIYSLAAVFFCWILLWFLWRKRIFLKV
ncbi:MAG TPA: heparan-alpha-glucosaminide N-acetyltransferase domain-containing protein [Candidatus Sulfotelmatobacter sp.]|nr:heparan-alpha-glucosaminide N-acetyltransferase domain-containing protein [Candidatus Sulfotelmatobacter sp.]